MNKVVLIGRLGKDSETTTFDSGKKVTKFSLATSENYGNNKEAVWHNIEVWGDYGVTLSQYLKKGGLIAVEGRIVYNAYEANGVKKIYTTIAADRVELLDSKASDGVSSSNQYEDTPKTQNSSKPQQNSSKKVSTPAPSFVDDTNDDLPF